MDSLCTHTQRVSFCSQGRGGGGREERERETTRAEGLRRRRRSPRRSSATVHEQRHHLRATFLPEASLPSPRPLSSRSRRRARFSLFSVPLPSRRGILLYPLTLGRARFGNNAKERRTNGLGRKRRRRRKDRDPHSTPPDTCDPPRSETEGERRKKVGERKERQDRWDEREEGRRARTKRRCQRDDETKQRENGFRTNTRPGTLASSERNYQAHARIAFLLSLFYFSPMLSPSLPPSLSLSFSPLRSLCYLL